MNENGQEAAQAAKACLPCLIEAMSQPGFFPDRPASVELRQTHISYVLLAGEYAYKIKKPVRFPFLSCGTLAERYRLCQEEVRLNRRLAPDIYLGVFPIMAAADGFALGPQSRTFDPCAFEYVVKMRRLPEDRMLDRLVANNVVGKEVIRALADKLAGFHREAPAARSWTCGSAASIWRTVVGDLEQNERFVGNTIEAGALAAIEEHCRGFVMSHWELLNDRARERRVRECHGDLRCGSVCLTEPVTIYDCLEFNEHLRYCDVASEIAFLAMDFDRLGAPGLADELVSAYAEAAGDETLKLLVPFYKCYRACVRGKVESLRSLEEEVPREEREQARELARRHFALALHYVRAASPAMLVVCGASGTGKSTVARLLQLRTGFEIIASDRIRKGLAGVAATAHIHQGYGGGIYSEDFNQRTYDAMLARAEQRLREGCGVIVDATFKDPAERARFLKMAAGHGTSILFVECRAEVDEVLRRLREREHKAGEISDATAAVYLRQRAEFAPLDEIPERSHVTLDTAEGPEENARQVEAALERLFSPLGTNHASHRAV